MLGRDHKIFLYQGDQSSLLGITFREETLKGLHTHCIFMETDLTELLTFFQHPYFFTGKKAREWRRQKQSELGRKISNSVDILLKAKTILTRAIPYCSFE